MLCYYKTRKMEHGKALGLCHYKTRNMEKYGMAPLCCFRILKVPTLGDTYSQVG